MMSTGFLPAIKLQHQSSPQSNNKPDDASSSSLSSWYRQLYNFIEEEDKKSMRRAQAFALRPISSNSYQKTYSTTQISPEKAINKTACRRIRATFDNSQLQNVNDLQSNAVVLDQLFVSPSKENTLSGESNMSGCIKSSTDTKSYKVEQLTSPKRPMRQYRHSMPSIMLDSRGSESELNQMGSPVLKFNSEEIDLTTSKGSSEAGETTETKDLITAIADMEKLDHMITTDLLSLRCSQ
jgi:hypothetical protein